MGFLGRDPWTAGVQTEASIERVYVTRWESESGGLLDFTYEVFLTFAFTDVDGRPVVQERKWNMADIPPPGTIVKIAYMPGKPQHLDYDQHSFGPRDPRVAVGSLPHAPPTPDLLPSRSVKRLGLLAAVAVLLAGCGSSSTKSTTTAAATTVATPTTATGAGTGTASAAPAGCKTVAQPKPKGTQHLKAPTLKLDPTKTYTVTVVTNCGTFAFTLDVKQQPKTSASVYSLVKSGFYDDLTFHRIATDFVIQGGDPLGTGQGGPGYEVVENPPSGETYPVGTVAMAKTASDPNGASGSQFFVMTGNSGLPPQYAVAGTVVSGQKVVQLIGSIPTNPAGDGTPTTPVVMSKVTVKVS